MKADLARVPPDKGTVRRATITDVARRVRVSKSVVSAVLNENQTAVRFSSKTRARILKVIGQIGFQRNPISVALRTGKRKAVGIYLGDPYRLLSHSYGAILVANIQKACASRGYSVVLMPLTQTKCDFRLVDGLILMGRIHGDDEAIRQAAQAVITISWMANLPPEYGTLPIDWSDQSTLVRQSHEMAAQYLYGLGHRHITIIDLKWTTQPAEKIFQQVARKMAMDVRLITVIGKWYDYSYSYLTAALNDQNLPTAFYVFDDEVGQQLINALSRQKVSVPGDVSVLSRETFETEKLNVSGITGITPRREMSIQTLLFQFIDVLEGKHPPKELIMPAAEPRLIERLSCASPRVADNKSG